MQFWLRDWWKRMTTKPCAACGVPVPVTEYRNTGRTRKVNFFFGQDVEVQCPNCGVRFWKRK